MRRSRNKSLSFWQYFEQHINDSKRSKTAGSVRAIRSARNNLKKFELQSGYTVTWSSINLSMHSKLLQFFSNLSPNTVGSNFVKNIKTVLEAAYIDGHHNNLIYKSKRFYKPSQKAQTIYLTEEEIGLLENFSGLSERLENVRKLFLIEYYSGKRFSELQRLDLDEHLQGNILKFLQPKTGKMVTIPISTKALRLMESSPRVISMQKYNLYLKELCKMVGINSLVVDSKKNCKVPKSQLVSSHAARRSFATNAWLAGVPIDHIQFMLGHSDVKTTHRYILAKDEEKAKKIGQHPWLNGLRFSIQRSAHQELFRRDIQH